MALLHSTLVGSMALYLFLFSDVITPTVIRQEVPLLKLSVCILVGYTMADTVVLASNPTADVSHWSMFVHHVICLYTGHAAAASAELPYYQLQWILMELANPFNNLRLMALLDSTLVGSMALYLFLFSDVIAPTVIRQEVPLLKLAVCILVGYTMAETLVLASNPTADVYDWSMFLHHVICLYTGYAAAVASELPYYQLQWMLMELSNPFNNLRFILKELGQKTSTLYQVNGIVLVAMFFLARVAPIPFFWYHLTSIIQSEDFSGVTFSMKVVALVLSPMMHLLNLFWFYKIFTGLLKHLSTKAGK